MIGLCKVTLLGNLGKDPELRYSESGKAVTMFTIAVNRLEKDPDGQLVEMTEWFKVICFNKLAEHCDRILNKGSHAYVSGRLKTHTWTDEQGMVRIAMEVLANDVQSLSPSKNLNRHREAQQSEMVL